MTTSAQPSTSHYDLVVVGGGIVGLATARELLSRRPALKLIVVEKEDQLVKHQSGHNSGVLHTGIYYAPGSFKAKACVAGRQAMVDYCDQHNISYELCGKLIVALNEDELPRLQTLYERGLANGVQGLEMVGPERLKEIEPFATGIKAIWSPNTGIVDYVQVAHSFAQDIRNSGGEIVTGCAVTGIETRGDQSILSTSKSTIEAGLVVTCAGLHSDRIALLNGDKRPRTPEVQIVPFRGDYYLLRPEKRHMTRGMIYPVPDPRFPFLGVHYTRRPNGEIWVGPNAVLAFAREGYGRWNFNARDLWEVLTYPGFWKLARKFWRMGAAEMYRDYVKSAYVNDARRYMPALTVDDLVPGPSGVRAQALSREGALVDDFLIKKGDRVVHVQNAPSPAATSSLVIARNIVDELQQGGAQI